MGKSKDLATGASYVDTAGDTMSGDLSVTGADVTITGSTNTDATLNVLSPNWVTGAYADINIAYQPTSRKIRGHYDNGIEIFTNNTNAALKVDPNGRVTKPYQPSFHVQVSSNQTIGSGITLAFGTVHHNIGSHFSTSNNRFTVPVAGQYQINYTGLHNSGSGNYSRTYLMKNGTAELDGLNNNQAYGSYERISWSVIVSVSVNDYLEIFADGSNTSGFVYNHYTHWSGHLLG